MEIASNIFYVGVNDHLTDLFEGQYKVPLGMSYNSYLIKDEKIAVMDSVDIRFFDEWISNIDRLLCGSEPDYIVVQHMEPDHSSSLFRFTEKYKNATVIASKSAFNMMRGFFGSDFADRRLIVGEGDTLSLGERSLTFVTAPMVHWPEVIVSYEAKDGILFSADGFGKFGALDYEDEWACEARRYYFGIVGKYGAQVQALLKKAAALKINKICPLHGPVLTENIEYYISLYDTWSSYRPEDDGVTIAYTSVYGNTKAAVELLTEKLKEYGVEKISVSDLARCDMAEAVEDAFRYDRLVLATTTYNGDVFPFMKEFINHLTERGYKNRKIALIENGTWAPTAAKIMERMLEGCQNIEMLSARPKILSSLSDTSKAEIDALAKELAGAR